MPEKNTTKVGVGVMIWKDGKVLLGKRESEHGHGEYSFPGGHLEMLESFEDAVRRETIEETGILVDDIHFLHIANIDYYNPKHYINIGFVAKWKGGEPRVMEPDKIVDWGWYTLEDLPQPLFLQTRLMINSFQKNINFYDQKDLQSF